MSANMDYSNLSGWHVVPYNETGIKPFCRNCLHWRDKAWVDKGWGICDNPKNEVYLGTAIIGTYVKDPIQREELKVMIENGIRYPEDFGCIFFEPIEK